MTPTIAADASSAAAICLAARSLAGDVRDQDEQQHRGAQARGDAKRRCPGIRARQPPRRTRMVTIAASGSEIGVRHVERAPAPAATRSRRSPARSAIVSSTVVSVKPKIEPGSARSKGATAATSITLAGSAHEPASVRACDTRGMEITATSDKSGCRSAIQVPVRLAPDRMRGRHSLRAAQFGHTRCIRRGLGVNSRIAAAPRFRAFLT